MVVIVYALDGHIFKEWELSQTLKRDLEVFSTHTSRIFCPLEAHHAPKGLHRDSVSLPKPTPGHSVLRTSPFIRWTCPDLHLWGVSVFALQRWSSQTTKHDLQSHISCPQGRNFPWDAFWHPSHPIWVPLPSQLKASLHSSLSLSLAQAPCPGPVPLPAVG